MCYIKADLFRRRYLSSPSNLPEFSTSTISQEVHRMNHYPLRILLAVVFAAGALAAGCAFDQGASGLDSVIPAGAKLEKVTGDISFDTAGSPCWFKGALYFTNNNFDDLEKSRVMRMEKPGDIRVIRANNGMTATLKPNKAGNLYACEMMGHRVIEMDTSGRVLRTVVGEYNGKRIDGPNDMALDARGGFYFTDSQFIGKQEKMQDKPAVYYVIPDSVKMIQVWMKKDTIKDLGWKIIFNILRVVDDVAFPNGVAFSPDEKVLYLANTQGKYLLAYDVVKGGTLANRRNFAVLDLSKENIAKKSEMSGADGVATDSKGNVYVVTTQGLGVQVFDRSGKHLGNIPCPAPTNNCAFGGPDMKTLYVSAKDGIYRIPVKNAGFRNF